MFLSHPIDEEKNSLMGHSIAVAQKTREILDETTFGISEEGYYTGLLHDVGKLNPIYQEIFSANKSDRNAIQNELEKIYQRVHSPFSAWAAFWLLDTPLSDDIQAAIYGHHSQLRNTLPKMERSEKFENSQKGMYSNLEKFYAEVKDNPPFSNLNWEKLFKRFSLPVYFGNLNLKKSSGGMFHFVRTSVLFSALLQADRGSFSEWQKTVFDLNLDTSKLVSLTSPLSDLRTRFQNLAVTNYDSSKSVSILHAPTGIGKTKVFLDIILRHFAGKLDRVIYFSPLLALTDDFEKKITTVVGSDIKEILTYNHLFSGSLSERKNLEDGQISEYHWLFDDESFNRKFVITTTQRLLMVLYSNSASDKIKLASLKNSLLIIDEVQTIPKFFLKNLVEYLQIVCQNMNTKVLLVSATIPDELTNLPKIKSDDGVYEEYLKKTKKNITYQNGLDIVTIDNDKILIMANTKKRTSGIFSKMLSQFDDDQLYYLSTGIRKKQRLDILRKISSRKDGCILVSTQVVEAGVDISFSKIFREPAPLDNVVQVMGRLNREGSYPNALLTIFEEDETNYKPYSELEYNESKEILRTVSNSYDLYSKLPKYYERISDLNTRHKALSNEIARNIEQIDYEKAWDFVYTHVLPDDVQENVFLPETKEQWYEIKSAITTAGGIKKDISRRYSLFTASLPKSPKTLGILDMFDEELSQIQILMPKLEHLDAIYDKKMGLDVWLTK